MAKTMYSNRVLACVLLIVMVGGVGLADTVININPHKIVLNAKGASDDVQANVNIVMDGAQIVDFEVFLYLDGEWVAEAESAFYCVKDSILIVGFDRTELQENPDVQEMANQTVEAIVDGTVTVRNSDGIETTYIIYGTDMVEIVAPGKKG